MPSISECRIAVQPGQYWVQKAPLTVVQIESVEVDVVTGSVLIGRAPGDYWSIANIDVVGSPWEYLACRCYLSFDRLRAEQPRLPTIAAGDIWVFDQELFFVLSNGDAGVMILSNIPRLNTHTMYHEDGDIEAVFEQAYLYFRVGMYDAPDPRGAAAEPQSVWDTLASDD